MKRNYFFLFFLMILTVSGIFAQSNEIIDKLLTEDAADLGSTAYMVLSAASMIDENTGTAEAAAMLADKGMGIFKGKNPSERVTFGEYSYMLMEAFGIKGGIMYRLIPGPRYASREIKYMGFSDKSDPSASISGEEVLRILGYVLEWKEGNK